VPEGVGHAPLVDFCNQHNPRARPPDDLNPGPRLGRLPSSARLPRPGEIETSPNPQRACAHCGSRACACALVQNTRPGGAEPSARDEPRGPLSLQIGSSRGFTGQGPDGFHHPAPLAAIPRGESFAPTRSARTPRVVSSWRRGWKPTTPGAGGRAGKHASPVRLRAHLASPLSRCPPRPPGDPLTRGRRARKSCSRSLPLARMGRLRGHHPGPRAASPDPPRRGPRSAAPEVPSIHGLPRPGQDVLHSLSPTCGKPPAPF